MWWRVWLEEKHAADRRTDLVQKFRQDIFKVNIWCTTINLDPDCQSWSTTIHTLATRDVHHHWHWCDKHLDALPTIRHIKRYIWSNYWCNKKDTIYQYCNVVRFNTIWFNTKRFNVIWYDLMRCKRMMLCNSTWYGLILSLKHKA